MKLWRCIIELIFLGWDFEGGLVEFMETLQPDGEIGNEEVAKERWKFNIKR